MQQHVQQNERHGVTTSSSATPPKAASPSASKTDAILALDLMTRFSRRTNIEGGAPTEPRRYLWTDAFAVCNLVGLSRAPGSSQQLDTAKMLVTRVHQHLGRHRHDDPRQGWLSGLTGEDANAHPTKGGLRIGKELPERGPGEPYEPRLEWERDGQYFHYLTQWMHALDVMARATGHGRYNRWSRELAAVAHDGFAYTRAGRTRMHWKMSVDLSRPLVPSMGQQDPLDGFVTYAQLDATARRLDTDGPSLDAAIRDFATMIGGRDWVTADPLGLGGLLIDAYRVAQLRASSDALDALLQTLLEDASEGLEAYLGQGQLSLPAHRRLAFRELGLAIGLYGVGQMQAPDLPTAIERPLSALSARMDVRERLIAFWSEPDHRRSATYRDHLDINDVMLATALAPEGCLVLPDFERARDGGPMIACNDQHPRKTYSEGLVRSRESPRRS